MVNINTASNESENLKNSQADLTSQFIFEFTKHYISSDSVNFLNDLMWSTSILDWDPVDLRIKSFESKTDKFNELDKDKVTIEKLKRAVWRDYTRLENSRSAYLENTFSKYNLDKKQRSKLQEEIKTKNEIDLRQLTNSDIENKKFLDKYFGKNKISQTNNLKILESISESDIQTRLSKLSPSDKKNIEESLFNLKNFKATQLDLKELFSNNFFNPQEKEEIISQFIPYLTLQEALELWIISSLEAEKQKEKILKPLLQKAKVDSAHIANILSSTSLYDIKIKSDNFFSNNSNLDIIANGIWFANFEKDLEKIKKDFNDSINKNWPQTLKELIAILSWEEFSSKFENINHFSEWNFIKIVSRDSQWEWKDRIIYSKISQINEKDKKILLSPIWTNDSWKEIINLSSNTWSSSYSFWDFLENFKTNSKNAIFYKKEDLNKLIEDPTNDIRSSELKQYSSVDLKNQPELSNKLKKNYISKLEEEKIDLENEKLEIDSKITSLKDSITKENKKDIQEQISLLELKKSQIEQKIKNNYEELTQIQNWKIKKDDLISYNNKIELINKLDELDPQGKDFWLEKWSYIKSKAWIHEIAWIDFENWNILLKWYWIVDQQLNFDSFFQAFKKNDAKRVWRISNIDEFLRKNSQESENKDIWNKYEIKNGKIHIKEIDRYSKVKETSIDYLISNNSNDLYKIEKISWDLITFRMWERKDINSLDKKQKSKYKDNIKLDKDWKPETKDWEIQYEWEQIYLDKTNQILTLSEFNQIINKEKNGFFPDWQTWKYKTKQNPQEKQNKTSWNFITLLFNKCFSLSELLSWWNLLVDNFKEYLAKWNDIHAAKTALAIWKFLPEEMKAELLVKVERAENESMEKEIENLWKVDSKIATQRIKSWLLNKDTPEFKKEAWMLFVISKYWMLTWKTALHEFKWKFLWYEAFGWKIWDEHFMEIKKKSEKSWQCFSEENLLFILLKKQCNPYGYNWIKRRSRLHKEFEWKWWTWLKEEEQKWYDDASWKRTASDMIQWGNDELLTWTLPNAIWWYRKAIDLWGSPEEMTQWFFLMLFSWALYNTDQKVYSKFLKTIWTSHWMPQIMARMSSNLADMKLMNKTIVSLSYMIEKKEPSKYIWMTKKAQEIYDKAINNEWTERDRLNECKKFWDKYWKVLTRSMNMISSDLDESNDLEYAETDKILIEKKDTKISSIENSEEAEHISNLQKYFSKTQDYTIEPTFKKDFMEDAYWSAWIWWLNILENTKKYLRVSQGWWLIEEKAWSWFWERLSQDLKRLKNKKVIEYMLSQVFAWFITNHGQNIASLKSYNHPTSDIWKDLNSWGINIYNDLWKFSPSDILNWTASSIISRIASNILSWNLPSLNIDTWLEVSNDTKASTEQLLKWK